MAADTPLYVEDLRVQLNGLRWINEGDAVVLSIYNPETKETTNYPLTAIELDPRDTSVGIPTGALYLCALSTSAEVQK